MRIATLYAILAVFLLSIALACSLAIEGRIGEPPARVDCP